MSDDSKGGKKAAVEEAIARAREVAAKIGKQVESPAGFKRSAGSPDSPPDIKKVNKEGLSATEIASMKAAEVARQINKQLGLSKQVTGELATVPSLLHTEHLRIPDSFVGLVIGKGGEKIAKIQTDSACKVQIAQELIKGEAGENMDRLCTLTGNREAISRAKSIITEILEGGIRRRNAKLEEKKKDNLYGEYGNKRPDLIELTKNVPTDRAGYVIGKGGETIKDINRRSGAHVETDRAMKAGEPGEFRVFRIRGTKEQVELALEMIAEKVQPPSRSYGQGSRLGPYGQYDRRDDWSSHRHRYNAPVNNIPTWQQIPSEILYQNPTVNWATQWQTLMMSGLGSTATQAAAGQEPTITETHKTAGLTESTTTTTDVGGGHGYNQTVVSADGPAKGHQQDSTHHDYTLQWIQYYRSIGMHEQADAILKQMSQPTSTQPAADPNQGEADPARNGNN
ncbi:hypothetical protein ACOME3_008580 [Neoechinorhynchus agilis]